MKITPKTLREAAERVHDGEDFMCFAVNDALRFRYSPYQPVYDAWCEFGDLLVEHGVSLGGHLDYKRVRNGRFAREFTQNTAFDEVKKEERVLFLLFLAEAME